MKYGFGALILIACIVAWLAIGVVGAGAWLVLTMVFNGIG